VSRGMTQADLARQAQVTVSYVWRLESAGAAPGIDLVERLAKALGVGIGELLTDGAGPDPVAVLKAQARRLFDAVLASADRDDLLALNPLLARFKSAR
jgi:transcriptional regulator with XRE-family HTH domain